MPPPLAGGGDAAGSFLAINMLRPLRNIFHTPLVRRLRLAGFDLMESQDVRLYPDGSLWTADQGYCDAAMRVLRGPELTLAYTVAAMGLRALAPFRDTITTCSTAATGCGFRSTTRRPCRSGRAWAA
jgi:hypothetical protein